jgi:crotonobetainyl-CoA:carnitine CoA-transferase CaiB-like acyl-CoA transferase
MGRSVILPDEGELAPAASKDALFWFRILLSWTSAEWLRRSSCLPYTGRCPAGGRAPPGLGALRPVSGPLHGYRIVDLTSMVSGPLATMLLADQGADVVKVENPDGGDYTRSAPNRRGGVAATFLNNNRNKRSVALNLKHAQGVEILLRLVAGADVFIQNFRPGVAERMGIGEEAVRRASPSIVYVSVSGFGERGPYAAKPVYDPLVQALSGLATVQAGSDQARPRLVRTILPDKLTAITAAQAITAALLARAGTGEGQHVRVSMLEAVVAFLWGSDMSSQTFVGGEFPQQEAASFIDLIYRTRDDYISVAVQTDREWAALTRALEHPEWLEDPRFRTPALRQDNIDDRLELTQAVLRARSASEWLARLEAEGVPCAPVLTRNQLIRHPQILDNGVVIETEHSRAGRLRQARPAARFSRTPPAIRYGAPTLGEHTDAVLAELGYTAADIARLKAAGTVGARPPAEGA